HDHPGGGGHLRLQQSLRVAPAFASEAVRADELGEVAADVRGREFRRAHLVQVDSHPQPGRSQRRFTTGHAGSDYCHARGTDRHAAKRSTGPAARSPQLTEHGTVTPYTMHMRQPVTVGVRVATVVAFALVLCVAFGQPELPRSRTVYFGSVM